jgi:hypothetical protein
LVQVRAAEHGRGGEERAPRQEVRPRQRDAAREAEAAGDGTGTGARDRRRRARACVRSFVSRRIR